MGIKYQVKLKKVIGIKEEKKVKCYNKKCKFNNIHSHNQSLDDKLKDDKDLYKCILPCIKISCRHFTINKYVCMKALYGRMSECDNNKISAYYCLERCESKSEFERREYDNGEKLINPFDSESN